MIITVILHLCTFLFVGWREGAEQSCKEDVKQPSSYVPLCHAWLVTRSCVDWQGLAARGGEQLSLALHTQHEHFISSLGLAPLPGPVWAKQNMH